MRRAVGGGRPVILPVRYIDNHGWSDPADESRDVAPACDVQRLPVHIGGGSGVVMEGRHYPVTGEPRPARDLPAEESAAAYYEQIHPVTAQLAGPRSATCRRSRRSIAAAIRSGNTSGVQANAGTPSAASAVALSLS